MTNDLYTSVAQSMSDAINAYFTVISVKQVFVGVADEGDGYPIYYVFVRSKEHLSRVTRFCEERYSSLLVEVTHCDPKLL